jgi:hypothetical protein
MGVLLDWAGVVPHPEGDGLGLGVKPVKNEPWRLTSYSFESPACLWMRGSKADQEDPT